MLRAEDTIEAEDNVGRDVGTLELAWGLEVTCDDMALADCMARLVEVPSDETGKLIAREEAISLLNDREIVGETGEDDADSEIGTPELL